MFLVFICLTLLHISAKATTFNFVFLMGSVASGKSSMHYLRLSLFHFTHFLEAHQYWAKLNLGSNEEYEIIDVDAIVSSNPQFLNEIHPYSEIIKENLEELMRYYNLNAMTCNLGIAFFTSSFKSSEFDFFERILTLRLSERVGTNMYQYKRDIF